MAKEGSQWLEASDVIPMFPTLVWQFQIQTGLRDVYEPAILAALSELRGGLPALLTGQGWQSGHALNERDEFRGIVGCVERAARSVLQFLRIGAEAFEITGCWATVLAPGAAHKAHSHPNNYLSGVYYVRVQPGADSINFHDARPQTGVIRPPVVELTSQNTDQVVVRVRNGTLLMFPAWLTHSVDANSSNEERISLSFNVMFSSFTELLSKPLW